MGFFSYKCAVSGISIPAREYADLPDACSRIVMVLPDDSTIHGLYDGYGNIWTDHGGVNIHDVLAKFYYNRNDVEGDQLFNNTKHLTSPDGKLKKSIDQFNWEEPIALFDGRTLNELNRQGWKITNAFYLSQDLIKWVRIDHYTGQTFKELPVSDSCEMQGYFYDEDTYQKIKASV
jgi:hypothetical protein